MSDSAMSHFPQPVFLLSAPRSGSTWFQRLLQSHPKICGGEESHFFTLFAHPMNAAKEMVSVEHKTGPLWYIEWEEYCDGLRNLWLKIFLKMYKDNPKAIIHLEKTPTSALYIPEILEMFPRAKFIILVRDSRAVSSSLLAAGRSWGDYWAPKTIKKAATWWWRYNSKILNYMQENESESHLFVRYECLVANQAKEFQRIAGFLDIDVDGFELDGGSTSTIGPKGFSRLRGADGWVKDLSIYQKAVVWRYTRKLMREFGYECTPFGRRTAVLENKNPK